MTQTQETEAVAIRPLLDVVLEAAGNPALPAGCDQWAVRTVRPDFRSSRGFRWPFPPGVAEAPGPIISTNTGACPAAVGDGICVGLTAYGVASGGMSMAGPLLLCAVANEDILGADASKLRVRFATVVEVVDLRHAYLSGADLSGADLSGANLSRANLTRADLSRAGLSGANLSRAGLSGADLSGADLYGANLTRADLSRADLYGANLTRANMYGANLTGANLTGADLYGADLYGADLYGANLTGANLTGANLTGAIGVER